MAQIQHITVHSSEESFTCYVGFFIFYCLCENNSSVVVAGLAALPWLDGDRREMAELPPAKGDIWIQHKGYNTWDKSMRL